MMQINARKIFNALNIAFDRTATWVSKLSWWKFFLFAVLLMVSADILQKTFSSSDNFNTQKTRQVVSAKQQKQAASAKNKDPKIEIDDTGISIKTPEEPDTPKSHNNTHIEINADGLKEVNDNPSPTDAGISKDTTSKPNPAAVVTYGENEVRINLPKKWAKELKAEMKKAATDAAVDAYDDERIESSRWFQNFVLLLIFGLFGMKALMGGKVRADEKARVASAAAEREALLRQVSEAQMQMMQAQVEPHFLFNTLASVEYLIETNPPRAAAMQRSLITYLRAVLPQIRENAPRTNLGREADMVKSYLELLKMRMEERLNIDFIMPEGLRNASFPPMMLQSLVENSIKHGLEVKAEGGTLQFRAELFEDKLRVSVKDDGLGFGAVKSNGTGLGLQNIRERLKLIYKNSGQMIITANQPSGVCVMIEIPYEIAK
ncbi:MAG: histidine kinase [Undibacterium sp.]|nr:histidine kinase [Undibacterium sp.]